MRVEGIRILIKVGMLRIRVHTASLPAIGVTVTPWRPLCISMANKIAQHCYVG